MPEVAQVGNLCMTERGHDWAQVDNLCYEEERLSEGLPVPGSRRCWSSEATTNPPAADRCPAKREQHRVSRGHDG